MYRICGLLTSSGPESLSDDDDTAFFFCATFGISILRCDRKPTQSERYICQVMDGEHSAAENLDAQKKALLVHEIGCLFFGRSNNWFSLRSFATASSANKNTNTLYKWCDAQFDALNAIVFRMVEFTESYQFVFYTI